ncbi:MAG TPA: EAL domain-containing protein [Actinomycetota bacterium]
MSNPAASMGPVLPVEVDPSAVVQRSLAEARHHMGLDVAYLAEVRDGRRIYRWVDGEMLPDSVRVGTAHPAPETIAGAILAGTAPAVVADVGAHGALAPSGEVAEARIGAFVGVPVPLPDGSDYGALVCFSHDPRPDLDPSAVGYLHLLARIITDHLEPQTGEDDLRSALDRVERALHPGSVEMVFQPMFDISTGSLMGAEALARFPIEPQRAPNLWFEEAWMVGRGVDLELAAVDAALGRLAEIPPGSILAVNVSVQALLSPRLAESLAGVASERVVLELPERAPVENHYQLNQAVEALRATGARLAADDAGAGFDSLSHILELGPELIKFDVSLTRDVDTDPVRRALAASLVSFAGQFDAMVVAEGVETAGELEALRELGFGYAQGYFLGRPGPLPLSASFPSPDSASSASA